MKKSINLIFGIAISLIIFGTGVIAPRIFHIDSEFIPGSFLTHSTMLLLSLVAIYLFHKKGILIFTFQKVKFKYYIYGILIAIPAIIFAHILVTIILKIFGLQIDPSGNGHTGIADFNPLQFFLFVFLYASICEEFLFRGFTQNFFEPLKLRGIRISKNLFISMPVLLSGVLFGLGHLILLTSNTSGPIIFRIVIFATTLGFVAGYFQEKHKSILPAIIIHMTGNLPGLIMSFVL
ncbi:MAG: CPBP family intramembrane metalloprotease [Bacteroidales bacterium]|nr:CPBP family intramembrane metalloprotease [Bacteroidales bacterium]